MGTRIAIRAGIAAVVCALAGPATASAGEIVLPDVSGVIDPLAGVGVGELVLLGPAVTTGDPVSVTTTGGRLTGTVDPNGRATTYRFEYGTTPLYGAATSTQDAGAGDDPIPVSADIGDLAPGSIVHYRLVASNAHGESAGLDRILIVLPGAGGGGVTTDGPRLLNLAIPSTVAVGEPFVLRASGSDPDNPVNSIAIDFGDGPAFFAESACRLRPADRVFRDNRRSSFSVPYSFSTPGTHTVVVTLGSGDCRRGGATTTQTLQVEVTPAPAGKRGAVTTAADCRDADLLPSSRNLRRIEKATVCLVNVERRKHGLNSFRTNKLLRRAAALHNGYMVRGKFLAHQGPGEPSLAQRFRKVKYRGGGAENIGVGAGTPYATPRGMVAGWMNSAVHRANMLERAFRTVGVHVIARKPIDPALPGATYTVEFGTTRR